MEAVFAEPIKAGIKWADSVRRFPENAMNILTYKGYQGSFEYDPDADIFHGDVLPLTDVITVQGRSIDELKAALAESVNEYLSMMALQRVFICIPFPSTAKSHAIIA